MNSRFASFVSALALTAAAASVGCAGTSSDAGVSEGAAQKAAPPVACQAEALKAATYIDQLGWGIVASEKPVVTQASDGEFSVHSTVSGYTYKVTVFQDSKSEACVIQSVTTDGAAADAPGLEAACKKTALDAATYIDELGWGKVASEPLTYGQYDKKTGEFSVGSSVSGYTYKIAISQDPRSKACVVTYVK